MTTNPVVRKAMNTLAMNAVGRDKQDAASVEMWIGLFNNFLNWSLKKHGDPAKARKNGETILKNIEDSLDSDGGREQLKKMGWTMQKLRDALEKGLRERFVQNSVRTTNPVVRKALNSVAINAAGDQVIATRGKFKLVYNPINEGYWFYIGTYGEGLQDSSGRPIFGKDKKSVAMDEFKRLVATANSRAINAQFKVGDVVEAMRPQVHKLGVKGTVTRVKPDTIIVKWHDDGFEAQYGIEGNFKNVTPKQVVAPEQKLREELMRSGYGRDRDSAIGWLTAHRRGLVTKYGRDIYEKVRSETAVNARACNGKWVVLYRDGGKEKIDAPSHAEAKKIADEKSRKSGRGYISVIVDDGVDYGINSKSVINYKPTSEFEVGDTVRFKDSVRSVPHDEEYKVVKVQGNRITIRGGRDGGTSVEFQEQLEPVFNAAATKATANAVKTTNAVVAKALNAQLHDYEVPVVKRGVKSTVTIRRVADKETAKKLAADPLTGTEVDVSRSVSVLNAEAVCNERYLVQTLEGDRWETKKTTPSRMDADSYMRVYQRSYSLSDVRILRASDGAEIARG